MLKLNNEQKKALINKAKGAYLAAMNNGNTQLQINPDFEKDNPFKESCHAVSYILRFIAKDLFNVPDEHNKMYDCIFVFDENKRRYPHFINKIYDEIIDATIEQFNCDDFKFDSFGMNDEYYTELNEVEANENFDIYNELVEYYEQFFR